MSDWPGCSQSLKSDSEESFCNSVILGVYIVTITSNISCYKKNKNKNKLWDLLHSFMANVLNKSLLNIYSGEYLLERPSFIPLCHLSQFERLSLLELDSKSYC